MSLRTKFLVLIGLVGLTALVCTGAALWSARLVQRELVDPLSSTARVLDNLAQVRTNLVQLRGAVQENEPSPTARNDADALAANVDSALGRLGDERWHPLRPQVLRQRLGLAVDTAQAWFARHEEPDRAAATAEIDQMLEWVQRRERRVLDDAALTMNYGKRTWRELIVVLGASLAAAGLLSVLGLSLLRRWVSVPVASLREATSRIGAGDFDHRIPVHGSDELARLSTEVNQMAAMVRAMQEERIERERLAAAGQLLRRLVHNLRNPLSGIRGLAEITRAELEPGSELCENQDRIMTSVDRFARWLNDLMHATSPLAVTPAPHRLEPWLTGLVEAHRGQARLKRIDLRFEADGAPEEVVIDPRHLEHAVVAMISNAIEASPVGGAVRVRAGADNGASWRISVSDQGAGVPEPIRASIFTPYFTTKADGNGIGLAVAQEVARAHGGQIELTVKPPAGDPLASGGGETTFVLRLPRRPREATLPPSNRE